MSEPTQAERLVRIETVLRGVEETLREMRDDLKQNYVTKEHLALVEENMNLKIQAIITDRATEKSYKAPWWVLVGFGITLLVAVVGWFK